MSHPSPRPSGPAETMRERFGALVSDLVGTDERLFVLLTEISTDYFRGAAAVHPDRVVSLGIMEQTALSAAAGVALEGFIPVVHSIAPFIVLRPYEQIRDDFAYQELGVNIVSIGASYDYAEDGYTHHAPDDVPALHSLVGLEIAVPGTPAEFEALFRAAYADGAPTYFRLSKQRNVEDRRVGFGRLEVVRRTPGSPVVIAVGPMLDRTLAAASDLDVSVVYCTTVAPFDPATLRELAGPRPAVFLVEPWYFGVLVRDVVAAFAPVAVRIDGVGVPHEVTRGYGTTDDYDTEYGLTREGIGERLRRFLAAG